MHRSVILLVVAATLFASLRTDAPARADDTSARPPNILFIMTDQHRWDCTGANGNKQLRTPNFDRLPSEFLHRPLSAFSSKSSQLHAAGSQ